MALKNLSRPSDHRLRELVYVSLPSVPNIRWFGELMFEKAHQRLKISLQPTNQKLSQLHALRSVAFEFWQSILSSSAVHYPEFDEKDIYTQARLLGIHCSSL